MFEEQLTFLRAHYLFILSDNVWSSINWPSWELLSNNVCILMFMRQSVIFSGICQPSWTFPFPLPFQIWLRTLQGANIWTTTGPLKSFCQITFVSYAFVASYQNNYYLCLCDILVYISWLTCALHSIFMADKICPMSMFEKPIDPLKSFYYIMLVPWCLCSKLSKRPLCKKCLLCSIWLHQLIALHHTYFYWQGSENLSLRVWRTVDLLGETSTW